jgi:uncharacterized phiE125 gp8 family phage protein
MSDLTDLATVKRWLNITSQTDDTLLAALITSYSAYVESWLNRSFASQSYTERVDGVGSLGMAFSNYPVTAVASVSIDDVTIPAATNTSTPGYRFSDKFLYLNGYRFSRGMQNVTIVYTAGYATTPPEIKEAITELVAYHYKSRDRIGHSSKSLAGETVSYIVSEFPASVRAILNNYKKVIPQ